MAGRDDQGYMVLFSVKLVITIVTILLPGLARVVPNQSNLREA